MSYKCHVKLESVRTSHQDTPDFLSKDLTIRSLLLAGTEFRFKLTLSNALNGEGMDLVSMCVGLHGQIYNSVMDNEVNRIGRVAYWMAK